MSQLLGSANSGAPGEIGGHLGRAGLGLAGGASYLLKGLKFVYVEHRELARFYVVPSLIALLIIGGGWVAFGIYASDLAGGIWSEPDSETAWGILSVLWQIFSVLLWLVLATATALVTFVLFSVIVAPFNDVLSEQVEILRGTWKARPFSWRFFVRDIGIMGIIELKKALIKLLWVAPLFVLSVFVPVFGQILYVVVGGYVLSRLVGLDHLDWSMARRGWSASDRLAFVQRERWPVIGFGGAVLLVLLVPFAFVLVWPGAVAGGTLLFTRLSPPEKIGP